MKSPKEIADKIEELCWLLYRFTDVAGHEHNLRIIQVRLTTIHWILGHNPVATYYAQGKASYKAGVRYEWNGEEYVKKYVTNQL